MKIARSTLVLALAGAALSLSAIAGQLYKWTDANGRVQYSDTPPANQNVKTLQGSRVGMSSGPTTTSSEPPTTDAKPTDSKVAETKTATPQTTADQEQAFRKRQAEKKEAEEKLAKEAADKKVKAENCQLAKNNLIDLENGRVRGLNAKGEYEYFDDTKLASEKARTRQQIETLCK